MEILKFSEKALAEANAFRVNEKILEGRPLIEGVTIDGPFSKDIDDGVFLFKKGENFVLQTSISDVASVAKVSSELFAAALERASTRYYENFNKPMLPRILSDFRLSLLPDFPRPAITYEIEIGPDGEVVDFSFKETAFKNLMKLCYAEFDRIASDEPSHPFYDMFRDMIALSEFLLEKRRNNGALVIYDLLKGIYTNEEGAIMHFNKGNSYKSHIVIQEFMILTNKSLALYFAGNDLPLLYRNHSVRLNAPERNEIINQLGAAVINTNTLNALKKRSALWFERALYGPKLIGHYGLNEAAYTHITSPIRRSADLVNEHLIKARLHGSRYPFTNRKLTLMATGINKVMFEIKDEKKKAFKESNLYEARVLMNYSPVPVLTKMSPASYTMVMKAAVKDNVLLDSLEESFEKRISSGRLDVTILYALFFMTRKKDEKWARMKKAAIDYMRAKVGIPSQFINQLSQKGNIDSFETSHSIREDNFIQARTVVTCKGRQIEAVSGFKKTKKEATHEAAFNALCLLLKMPSEQIADATVTQIIPEDIPDLNFTETDFFGEEEIAAPTPKKGKKSGGLRSDLTVAEDKAPSGLSLNDGESVDLSIEQIEPALPDKILKENAEMNYTGELLELCAKNNGWIAPSYSFSLGGPAHTPEITCSAKMHTADSEITAVAAAPTKKAAKQAASRSLYEKIRKSPASAEINGDGIENGGVNFVGLVHELCIKNKLPLPEYDFQQIGQMHEPVFRCRMTMIHGRQKFEFFGFGNNKKLAKQNASVKSIPTLKKFVE